MPRHLAGKDRGGCTRGWRLRKASEPAQKGAAPRAGPALPLPSPVSVGHVGTGEMGDHDLPWPHSTPEMLLQHCPAPLLVTPSGHKELWHFGSESAAPGWNNRQRMAKGHYSSHISQAIGNMLHQGWTKLFLKLNPCSGCPRGRARDRSGVFSPPIVGAEPTSAQSTCHPYQRAGEGTDLMINSYLSRW